MHCLHIPHYIVSYREHIHCSHSTERVRMIPKENKYSLLIERGNREVNIHCSLKEGIGE